MAARDVMPMVSSKHPGCAIARSEGSQSTVLGSACIAADRTGWASGRRQGCDARRLVCPAQGPPGSPIHAMCREGLFEWRCALHDRQCVLRDARLARTRRAARCRRALEAGHPMRADFPAADRPAAVVDAAPQARAA